MSFNKIEEQYKELIENRLKEYLEKKEPDILYESGSYSIFNGGKRVRPILMLGSYNFFKNDIEEILPFACAMEMIHTYSLIHDDLPAMDNDDFRRGKPTNHKVYGESVAILAGDFLLNLAHKIMIDFSIKNPSKKYIEAMRTISDAGVLMIKGQTLDILSEDSATNEKTLAYIHENKTAALIRASITTGVILGSENYSELTSEYEKIGLYLGLAFQIKDDLLDITSNFETLGKPIGSDSKNKKISYVSLYGKEKAEEDFLNLSTEALNSLKQTKNNFLIEYAARLMKRTM